MKTLKDYTNEELIELQGQACEDEDYSLANSIEIELIKRAGF